MQDFDTIDYRRWVLDIVSWDGILPACIFGISWGVARLFPVNPLGRIPGPGEVIMVVLPIVGVLVRFYIGNRKIQRNYCSPGFKRLQRFCLHLTLVFFLVFDFVVVLSTLLQQPVGIGPGHWLLVLGVAAYFCVVGCAMYPGRKPIFLGYSDLDPV